MTKSAADTRQRRVSIHAPHEGERPDGHAPAETRGGSFNPRSPRGGATWSWGCVYGRKGVSIHAPHEGERLILLRDGQVFRGVSIHAPHEGERRIDSAQSWHDMIVSIHAPHEGERP